MTQHDQSATQYLVFRLGAEHYALPLLWLQAIERWQTPTAVPGTPPALLGIISQRGTIMAVVDVRVLIGGSIEPPARQTRLIIARHGAIDVALVVDQVLDIEWYDGPTTPLHATDRSQHISSGVVLLHDRTVRLLDLGAVLELLGTTEP